MIKNISLGEIFPSSNSNHYQLNKVLRNFIEGYFKLDFYGLKVRTPYFINPKGHKDLRSLVGKGTQEEIILETKVWAQVKNFNLTNASEIQIRDFMQTVGIGIDCSGLVVQTLKFYVNSLIHENLLTKLKFENNSIRARLARLLRTVENIGANDLTSDLNCTPVGLNQVRPGDLIRAKGKQFNAHHVALVTHVDTIINKTTEIVTNINYIHSHRFYGHNNGVRAGSLIIKDINGGLLDQDWKEISDDGINYLVEDLKINLVDNGFRRLKLIT